MCHGQKCRPGPKQKLRGVFVLRRSSSLALHVTFFQANQNGYCDQKGYHRENLRRPDAVFSRLPVADGSGAEIVHSFGNGEISPSYPTRWTEVEVSSVPSMGKVVRGSGESRRISSLPCVLQRFRWEDTAGEFTRSASCPSALFCDLT